MHGYAEHSNRPSQVKADLALEADLAFKAGLAFEADLAPWISNQLTRWLR
jgi:hypothetical protein